MEGFVRKETPRLSEKFEAVKTQKELPLLEEHIGSTVQGSGRSNDLVGCSLRRGLE
jgi:hypothetical protein